MKTIEDLSFLKAQAADLERLIRIAPPSAVIAKYQYEERLSDVRETITSLEEAVQQDCEPTNSCSEIDDSIQMNYARRVLKSCQLATRLLRRSLISESEPLHIPSIANHLENQKFSQKIVETSLLEVYGTSCRLLDSMSGWRSLLSECERELDQSQSSVRINTTHPLYELVFSDLVHKLDELWDELTHELEQPQSEAASQEATSQIDPHNDAVVKLFLLVHQGQTRL